MWLISKAFVLVPVLPADSQEHDGVLEQRPTAASLIQGAEPQRGERLGQHGQMSGGGYNAQGSYRTGTVVYCSSPKLSFIPVSVTFSLQTQDVYK